MTHTIEETAKEYSERLGKSRDVTWNDGEYGFIAGANYIMSLPLASRLTNEEKVKIREQYDEVRIFTEDENPPEYYLGQKVVLERIFGKGLSEQ